MSVYSQSLCTAVETCPLCTPPSGQSVWPEQKFLFYFSSQIFWCADWDQLQKSSVQEFIHSFMMWFSCTLLSPFPLPPQYFLIQWDFYPQSANRKLCLIAPLCHMLLQMHLFLEPRDGRAEKNRKQQDFVLNSWDHSVTDWKGKFYFFRVFAVASFICYHCRIACRLDFQSKERISH